MAESSLSRQENVILYFTSAVLIFVGVFIALKGHSITKTRLSKYIDNFTTKKPESF